MRVPLLPLHSKRIPPRSVHGPCPPCGWRAPVAGLDTAPVADRVHHHHRRGRRGGDRLRRCPRPRRPARPGPLWPAAGVRPRRRGADPAGRGEDRRLPGHARGLGTARRDPAAAGLRAAQPDRPDRRDAMAGAARLAAPPGVQRGRPRPQLPGRRVRLPPAGRRDHRARAGSAPARLRLDADGGRRRARPAAGQLGPGTYRGQGVRPCRPAPRRPVRAGAAVQRHGGAVPGGAGLVRRREQPHHPAVRFPVRLAATADRAARPAGDGLADRLQDRAAERGHLAAGGCRRGRAGRARRAAARRRRARPGLVQAGQRHTRAPVRR